MNAVVPHAIQSRSVAAGRAIDWCTDAWALFTRAPLIWVALTVATALIYVVMQFVPVLGQLGAALLGPVFVGGFQLAARKVDAGGTPALSDLFAAFESKGVPLLILGAIMLGITLIAGLAGAGALLGGFAGMTDEGSVNMSSAIGAGLAGFVLLAGAFVLITMCVWFAPALVLFHDASPLEAIRASFVANLKNIPAFAVFGVLYLVAAIIATIPAALGWLILLPLLMLASWTSYRDVFGQ